MNENEVIKCPRCGKEMEKGHLHFLQNLRWHVGEHQTYDITKGEPLFDGQNIVVKKAYRCAGCGLLLFDYHDEIKIKS